MRNKTTPEASFLRNKTYNTYDYNSKLYIHKLAFLFEPLLKKEELHLIFMVKHDKLDQIRLQEHSIRFIIKDLSDDDCCGKSQTK